MDETQEKYFHFGWLVTLIMVFVVKYAFPNLGEEAALVIIFTPMLILLIALQKDKDPQPEKDSQ